MINWLRLCYNLKESLVFFHLGLTVDVIILERITADLYFLIYCLNIIIEGFTTLFQSFCLKVEWMIVRLHRMMKILIKSDTTNSKKGGIVIRLLKRLFAVLLIAALILWTKPLWGPSVQGNIPEPVQDFMDAAEEFFIGIIPQEFKITNVKEKWQSFYTSLMEDTEGPAEDTAEDIELESPEKQSVSVGNVELGDTKKAVDEVYGEPESESENEYGVNWSSYHENYQNFMMVAYDEDEVVRGLYTNQDLFSSEFDISLGNTKEKVNEELGEPEEVIRNGWFNYRVNSEGEYDVYEMDGDFITFFYDLHVADEDEVAAVQIIDDKLESTKDGFYATSSEALQKGFETQLFELTNAARVKHDLPVLDWNEDVSETARKHSSDMAENNYFSHTNLEGQSAADRMREDEISFVSAGENLAYGQFSSIFAHQGLMNSAGHRENILHNGYTELGTGVDFDESDQPFYTENYLSR